MILASAFEVRLFLTRTALEKDLLKLINRNSSRTVVQYVCYRIEHNVKGSLAVHCILKCPSFSDVSYFVSCDFDL